MHVAIGIVGFRNAGDIAECLKALKVSTHADFEVVICENGGPSAHAALAATLPTVMPGGQPVRTIEAPGNLGYAGGVNVCLEAASEADAWWVLNPDTQPSPGALAALVARLSKGDCEAVGGILVNRNGAVQSYGGHWRSWLARAESLGMGSRLEDPMDAAVIERRQSFLNGACMLIGRRFLATVGPMREDYFLYCEEVEWCLRGLGRGMRLGFAPEALVTHAQGTTTGSSAHVSQRSRMPIFLDERNKILVTRDCFRARLPVAVLAAAILLVARYGSRGAWSQLGYGFEGWWDGIRNRRGPVFGS